MANNWKYWIDGTETEWAVGAALPAGADWQRAEFLNQFIKAINDRNYLMGIVDSGFTPTTLDEVSAGDDLQLASFWNGLMASAIACMENPLWLPATDIPENTWAIENRPIPGNDSVWVSMAGDCYFQDYAAHNEDAQDAIDALAELSAGDYITASMLTNLRNLISLMNVVCHGTPCISQGYAGTWASPVATFGASGPPVSYQLIRRTFAGVGLSSATTVFVGSLSATYSNPLEKPLRFAHFLSPDYSREHWRAWESGYPATQEPVATIHGSEQATSGDASYSFQIMTASHEPPPYTTNNGNVLEEQQYFVSTCITADFDY